MRIEDDILEVARLVPQRAAIETNGRIITFGELDELTQCWAGQLRNGGLRGKHSVWMLMPNGPEFILGALAIVRAGGVAVPVDSRLTDPELAQLALSCPPAAIWCCENERSRVRGLLGSMAWAPRIIVAHSKDLTIERLESTHESEELSLQIGHGEPGVIYFSSGSTGRPKAILLTHENIASNARATAEAFGLRSEDRTVVCMRMGHAYTLTKQMLAHLYVGATLVLAPDFFQPAVVLDLVDRFHATTVCAVPSMHVMMYEQMCRRSLRLPTLRLLTTGGAPMPEPVQLGWCKRLPRVAFISSYGLSEASPCVTALPADWAVDKVGSIGRAIPGVEVRIEDSAGRSVAVGRSGELCVRGPNVMAGYLNDPAATARALRKGWLHTGDMGRMDSDGCVYLHGRKDDLILRGGENIYPVEIENAIGRHPAVLEAAVVGVSHSLLGQDIAAFVTLRDGVTTEVTALREHCLRHLAAFKVPREIRIVSALPRTVNGKIRRGELRESRATMDAHPVAVSTKECL